MPKLNSWSVMLACALAALSPAVTAANAPSLPEFEQGLVHALDAPKSAAAAMAGFPFAGADGDLVRQNFIRLLREQPVREITRELLRQNDGRSAQDLYAIWLRQYANTLTASFLQWSDEDILRFMQSRVFTMLMDQANCVRLSSPRVKWDDLLMGSLSREEIAWYFATLRRGYVKAVSNEIPRPLPDAGDVDAAIMHIVFAMPVADREHFLAGNIATAGVQERCASGRALFGTLVKRDDAEARMVRRVELVTMVRAAYQPVHSTTRGASLPDGRFRPGAARLEYPLQAARAGIEGKTQVRISVDASGLATRVKIVGSTFNKPKVALDGEGELDSVELFDPVIVAYYRSGTFQQRFKDGQAVPYVANVELVWKLDDQAEPNPMK